MSKFNFPPVLVKSPTEALILLGIDEGATLEYNPASGMYVVSKEGEDIGPGDQYTYFAEAVGFSKRVIDTLLESGIVEELVTPESEEKKTTSDPEIDMWDKADLTMVCGRCRAEEKVTEAIGGATLFMPTTSQAETRLVCTGCGNTMSLLYRNGALMTEEEKAEFKAKQEAQNKSPKETLPEDYVNEDYDSADVKETSDEPQKESE